MTALRASAFCVAMAAAGYGASAVWSASHRIPRLEMSPEIDIGEIRHDEELELAIGFRNSGLGVLHLEPPVPGCKCAPAVLTRADLSPGEKAEFRFRLRPARPSGAEYVQSIAVTSNDPVEPHRTVIVRGRMAGALASQPQAVSVLDAPLRGEIVRDLIVHCTDRRAEFEILTTSCTLPGATLTTPIPMSKEAFPEGTAYETTVSFTPSRVGRSSGVIVIETSHPRYRRLEIPIEVVVRSEVLIEPTSVLLSAAKREQEHVLRISTTAEAADIRLGDLDAAVPLHVELNPAGDRRSWTLHVRLKPEAAVPDVQHHEIALAVSGIAGETDVLVPVTVLPSIVAETDED